MNEWGHEPDQDGEGDLVYPIDDSTAPPLPFVATDPPELAELDKLDDLADDLGDDGKPNHSNRTRKP